MKVLEDLRDKHENFEKKRIYIGCSTFFFKNAELQLS